MDYAATTPVDPRVAELMATYLTTAGVFGNPASRSHIYGWQAEEAVQEARQHVADYIHADSREIVWTSGATESDNLAIKGAMQFYQRRGKHLITSMIEHKAVLDTCRFLESKGFEVTYIKPTKEGVIDPLSVQQAIRDDTVLVSIMHVNNELGTINDIASIGKICRAKGVLFHVDGAQSTGKAPIDVEEMCIDLLSLSSHKAYGPKGIGALYVRRKPRIRLECQIHGGGHERGMRSGTLPTHQIVGIGEAFRLAKQEMDSDNKRFLAMRQHLTSQLLDIDQVILNGHPTQVVPSIINISFAFVEGESLLMALKDMAVSSGSACTSASLEPSYVLRALGLSDELAHSSIRFSLGRFTQMEDIHLIIDKIKLAVERLRAMSPLWDMHKEGTLEGFNWTAH